MERLRIIDDGGAAVCGVQWDFLLTFGSQFAQEPRFLSVCEPFVELRNESQTRSNCALLESAMNRRITNLYQVSPIAAKPIT